MSILASAEARQDDLQKRPRSDSGAVLLRPHHVMCVIGWQGQGYSPEFTRNMNAIVMGRLRADPATEVVFTAEADAICGPCPSRRGTGCEMQAKITGLDRRHAEALAIAPGARMSWADAQGRATSRLAPPDLDRICAGCRWLDLGLCKQALARLQEGGSATGGPDEPE